MITMGIIDDIIKGLDSLTNYKKADAEQTRAKTDKEKMKNLRKQNKELKKSLSKNQTIGIITVIIAIVGIIITIIL